MANWKLVLKTKYDTAIEQIDIDHTETNENYTTNYSSGMPVARRKNEKNIFELNGDAIKL